MNKNYTIDYSNNEFILFDLKHRSEERISRVEVLNLRHEGYMLTKAATYMLNS